MKRKRLLNLIFGGLLIISSGSYAQNNNSSEEESAAVFLDEYSDAFQEKFFEALKQKGIENDDKAIAFLLECKQINPEKKVVDFELAKLYLKTKQLDLAKEYALNALNAEPENFWYLHTLVAILNLQGSTLNEIASQINEDTFDTLSFQQNLVLVYYEMENYKEALEILNRLKPSTFTENIHAKIKSSLEKSTATVTLTRIPVQEDYVEENGTINYFKTSIAALISAQQYGELETLSKEALDNYPAQPYFYYARGLALNKSGNPTKAIQILEESLDYMLDDIPLKNDIYKELVAAYSALNNLEKANEYQKKINPGF